MGFLHKLWDETVAGPAPESGLGKLRKYDSFSASSASPISPPPPITRSITILRTSSDSRCFSSSGPASFPDSPPGPTTPSTPSTPGTPAGDFKKFTRRKSPTQAEGPGSTSPNISDWVIMSAFDG